MRRFVLILSLAMWVLAACAAPASAPPATGSTGAEPAPRPAPPMTTPYPPRQVPPSARVDYACQSQDDCAVKDVGNCCGAMPACVNKDSPTDPAAVRAQCAANGQVGVCGFQDISSCQCVSGRCEPAQSGAAEPVQVH